MDTFKAPLFPNIHTGYSIAVATGHQPLPLSTTIKPTFSKLSIYLSLLGFIRNTEFFTLS